MFVRQAPLFSSFGVLSALIIGLLPPIFKCSTSQKNGAYAAQFFPLKRLIFVDFTHISLDFQFIDLFLSFSLFFAVFLANCSAGPLEQKSSPPRRDCSIFILQSENARNPSFSPSKTRDISPYFLQILHIGSKLLFDSFGGSIVFGTARRSKIVQVDHIQTEAKRCATFPGQI